MQARSRMLDAEAIHASYSKFNLSKLRKSLIEIAKMFRSGTRKKRVVVRTAIGDLHEIFFEMEKAGVPPNFIVKLKQQQALLLKSLYRINHNYNIQNFKVQPFEGQEVLWGAGMEVLKKDAMLALNFVKFNAISLASCEEVSIDFPIAMKVEPV